MTAHRLVVDISVVGAGPAGSAAATVLARSGRSVLLISGDLTRRSTIGESLPPKAKPVLHLLGLVPAVENEGHLPCYGNESAWGSSEITFIDFLVSPWGCGWHLDRYRFDQTLRENAARNGVQVVCPAKVDRVLVSADGVHLEVSTPGGLVSVESTFLVDCTGRASAIVRRLGVRRRSADRLVAFAVLMNEDSAGDAHDVALTNLVESGPEGWWYTARLPHRRRIVVYYTDVDLPTCRQAREMSTFLRLLAETRHVSKRCVGCVPLAATPQAQDASTARLDQFVGERWLAAGDAALSLDPLSSQGILRALQSGVAAAASLEEYLRGDRTRMSHYSATLNGAYEEYRAVRRNFYAREGRWIQSKFWQRRAHIEETVPN